LSLILDGTKIVITGFQAKKVKSRVNDFITKLAIHKYPEHWEEPECFFAGTIKSKVYKVEPQSEEYKAIATSFKETLPAAKIIRVERIQNSKLWSTFCQEDDFIREKLGKDSNIRRLFHGTGTTSPDLIYSKSEEGFDSRYSKEGLWGRAIYFAERSAYSHNYSHKNSEGYN